jgi:hypothetical protein
MQKKMRIQVATFLLDCHSWVGFKGGRLNDGAESGSERNKAH